MSTITLANLRLGARRRADIVDSKFCLDAEINDWINESASALYDLMTTGGAVTADRYTKKFLFQLSSSQSLVIADNAGNTTLAKLGLTAGTFGNQVVSSAATAYGTVGATDYFTLGWNGFGPWKVQFTATDTTVQAICNRIESVVALQGMVQITDTGLIVINAPAFEAPLPQDFYFLRGMDYNMSGTINGTLSDWQPIQAYAFAERGSFRLQAVVRDPLRMTFRSYALMDTRISILPFNLAPGAYQMHYVPEFQSLASDTDVLRVPQNWHEYVIVDTAIKCLQKEESDVSALEMKRAELEARIRKAGMSRDKAKSEHVLETWDPEAS